MIQIVGELRKIDISEYTVKSSGEVRQEAVLIIEPKFGRKNYEVFLTDKQQKAGLVEWRKLQGKEVAVPVSLFVSFEHKFHKFNLLGPGSPALSMNKG